MDDTTSNREWYQFNYHNGNKISVHLVTPEFVERVRIAAIKRNWDVVITHSSKNINN